MGDPGAAGPSERDGPAAETMVQRSPAAEGETTRLRDRLRERRVVVAWLMVVAFAGVVLWLGTPNFSASQSYRWLLEFLRFFDPDVRFKDVIQVHHLLRKSMHVVVYALLALLAFRASWLSFGNLLARVSVTAILVALGVALIDELRQGNFASRTGSFYDVLIDGAGAALAVAIAGFALRQRAAQRRAREAA